MLRMQDPLRVLDGMQDIRMLFKKPQPVMQPLRRFLIPSHQECFVWMEVEERTGRQRLRRFVRRAGDRQSALFFEQGGKIAMSVLTKKERGEHECSMSAVLRSTGQSPSALRLRMINDDDVRLSYSRNSAL